MRTSASHFRSDLRAILGAGPQGQARAGIARACATRHPREACARMRCILPLVREAVDRVKTSRVRLRKCQSLLGGRTIAIHWGARVVSSTRVAKRKRCATLEANRRSVAVRPMRLPRFGALQRPMVAGRIKLPQRCRIVARHMSREGTPGGRRKLRSCPKAANCPTVTPRASIGPTFDDFRVGPCFGQAWPKSDRFRPTLVDVGPSLAQLGLAVAMFRPTWASIGQQWANIDQGWSTLGRHFGQTWSNHCQSRPEFVDSGPNRGSGSNCFATSGQLRSALPPSASTWPPTSQVLRCAHQTVDPGRIGENPLRHRSD